MYYIIAVVQILSTLLVWFILFYLKPGQTPWEMGLQYLVTDGSRWKDENGVEYHLTILKDGEISMHNTAGETLWETRDGVGLKVFR